MVEGLIGKKIAMTQIFGDDGAVTPVTVLEAGPCVVVQLRTEDNDGYEAVQLGLVDAKSASKANKPMQGHHAKANVPPTIPILDAMVDEDHYRRLPNVGVPTVVR